MRRLILLLTVSGAAFAACLPVTGSRILGRDLALADPRLGALPSTLVVGFSPSPGATKVYTVTELERIARANGMHLDDAKEICFEFPARPLTEEIAAAAMRRSLPSDAGLTIEELSKGDLPAGEVEFPLNGLEVSAADTRGVQMWRGYVRYTETRKAACWARVRLNVRYTAVVAARDLPAGRPIDSAAVRVESRSGTPERVHIAASLDEVRGRALKRPLTAGSAIPVDLLVDPPDVQRGDAVHVEVRSGPARLQFEVFAEGPAREGDLIELHNPVSGKPFRARLEAGQKAVVVVSPGDKL